MSSKSGATTSATSGGDFSCINPGGREELVGKRFLLVSSNGKLKLSRISEWNWKAGVIRSASHVDIKDPELQVRFDFIHITFNWIKCLHMCLLMCLLVLEGFGVTHNTKRSLFFISITSTDVTD